MKKVAVNTIQPGDSGDAQVLRWRPIETAPKDESILVYITGATSGMDFEIAHCASDDPDGDWYSSTNLGGPFDMPPTHWMPLHEPPQ